MTQPTEDFPFVRSRDLEENPSLDTIVRAIRSMMQESGNHHWGIEDFYDYDEEDFNETLIISSILPGNNQKITIRANGISGFASSNLFVGYDPDGTIAMAAGGALEVGSTSFSGERTIFGTDLAWNVSNQQLELIEHPWNLTGNYRVLIAEHMDNECVASRKNCLTIILQRFNPVNMAIISNDWGAHVGRIGSTFDAPRNTDYAIGDAILVGKPDDPIEKLSIDFYDISKLIDEVQNGSTTYELPISNQEIYDVEEDNRSWFGSTVNSNGSAIRIAVDEWVYLKASRPQNEIFAGSSSRTLMPISLTAVDKQNIGNWVQTSAGEEHSLGIDADGKLWAWGRNGSGQLGTNDQLNVIREIPTPVVVTGLSEEHPGTWRWVSASNMNSFGIDADGKLWAWGNNNYGQLGDGNTSGNMNIPNPVIVTGLSEEHPGTWRWVSAGITHSLGIDANGKLWAWGENLFGRLGTNDSDETLREIPTPVVVTGLSEEHPGTWRWVDAQFNHSLGIDSNGKAWAWGYNFYGQLGDDDPPNDKYVPIPVIVAGLSEEHPGTWQWVSAGLFHSLGIDANGKLWAWGENNFGELGDDDRPNDKYVPTPVVVTGLSEEHPGTWQWVTAGDYYSLGIDADGKLWAWGRNGSGRLGTNDQLNVFTEIPTPVVVTGLSEEHPGTWRWVSAGSSHSLGIDANGKLWAWGENGFGQLGDDDAPNDEYVPILNSYGTLPFQDVPLTGEIARTKLVRQYGINPLNPNLKFFSTTSGSNQAWIPAGNGSSQLILWRRGNDNEEI